MEQFDKEGQRRPWPLWISVTLGIVAAISLVVRISQPVYAPDLWWHMALGRHVLDSGSLIIDHSIFTWTPATAYHVYNSWLADVILYLTHELAGTSGLIVLRFFVFTLFFILAWHYAIKRDIAGNPLTWVVILLGIKFSSLASVIKPELFSAGFMVVSVWIYFYMRFLGNRGWYLPYLFPLILVIWINMHGAFFIAALFFAATVIGELLNIRFSPDQAMAERLRRHFFIALALCIPAVLINPYGYELPLHIITGTLDTDAERAWHFSRIMAYRPTFLFNSPPFYLLDYMILAMLLFVFLVWQKLKIRQTDWVVILAFLGYCALFTQYIRVTFFLGPVFLFVSLDLLAKKEGSWAWPATMPLKTMLAVLCITVTLTIGWRDLSLKGCTWYDTLEGFQRAFRTSNSLVAVSETEFIKKNLSGKKIGNTYRDGGYLLYRLWPERQVMIDPRYFPFKDWFGEYLAFANGVNIDQFVKKQAADYWLVGYKIVKPFLWFSRSDDWELAFLGPMGGVFVPVGSGYENPIVSPHVDTMNGFGDIATAFGLGLQLDDLVLARHLYNSARKNLGRSCEKHLVLINEMKDTIAGVEAYHDGNYLEASRLLGKPTAYIHAQGKAAEGLMILAERSWNTDDFFGARKWCLETFKILPRKMITDIYNFALADWHYRHSEQTGREEPKDGLNWQNLVEIILQRENQLPERHRFIAETAKAMKEGSYDGKARLVPRFTENSPAGSTD